VGSGGGSTPLSRAARRWRDWDPVEAQSTEFILSLLVSRSVLTSEQASVSGSALSEMRGYAAEAAKQFEVMGTTEQDAAKWDEAFAEQQAELATLSDRGDVPVSAQAESDEELIQRIDAMTKRHTEMSERFHLKTGRRHILSHFYFTCWNMVYEMMRLASTQSGFGEASKVVEKHRKLFEDYSEARDFREHIADRFRGMYGMGNNRAPLVDRHG
jgi:hypothetical protein